MCTAVFIGFLSLVGGVDDSCGLVGFFVPFFPFSVLLGTFPIYSG